MSFSRPPFFRSVSTRRLFLVAAAFASIFSARLSAGEPLKSYEVLRLKDGRELTAVRVVNYTTTDVLVRHAGGATTLSTSVLPSNVLSDLHLPSPEAVLASLDPAFLALANKVAVSDASAPAAGAGITSVQFSRVPSGGSNVTEQQLQAAAQQTSTPTSAPAGEGNMTLPDLPSGVVVPVAPATANAWTKIAGRLAVAPTAGEPRYLANVEVRAYPADLLAKYVVLARAKAAEVADQLRERAAALAQAGRTAESEALVAQAAKAAGNLLNFLPVAPFNARSDEFGHFTLRHDLRDVRLVAMGRISSAQGEWTYAWIGVPAEREIILTDANATMITSPESAGASFAAR